MRLSSPSWARVRVSGARRRVAAGRAWWARSLYGSGFRRIRELDLDTHALALCAQQVLCFAPLIVAVSALLQRETGKGIGSIMSKFFGLRGDAANDVERLFSRSSPAISTMALLIAVVTALVFCTSVGAVQQRAFEMIWTLPRVSGVRSYLRQLVWTVVFGAFAGGVLLAGRIGKQFNHTAFDTGPVIGIVLQSLVVFAFYWWSQRWLLGGRVAWRALLPGAIAVAVLTAVLVRLSRLIVPGQISWQSDAYGLVGVIFILTTWLMILSAVIFAGVLWGALFVQRRSAEYGDDPGVVGESPLTAAGLDSAADSDDAAAASAAAAAEEKVPVGT